MHCWKHGCEPPDDECLLPASVTFMCVGMGQEVQHRFCNFIFSY